MRLPDLLRRTLVALERGQPIPEDCALLLRCAFERYLDREAATLDEAFDVRTGPGGHWQHPVLRDLHRQRNELLRALAGEFRGSMWQRAGALAALVESGAPHPLLDLLRTLPVRVPASRSALLRVLEADTVADRLC